MLRERRAVLLHGMGGIGKTAVALHVAQRLQDEGTFRDRVLWLGGEGVTSVAACCDALARQMGRGEIVQAPPADKPALARVALAAQDVLVILDGVASEMVAAQFVADCLPPGRALLVTSRIQHQAFAHALHLDRLDAAAAAALFRDRAALPSPDGPIGAICALLEGHPLALVIAAGRVCTEAMPLDRLHGRLADATTRLATLRQGERSVGAALQVSYDGLPADQRRVLTRLAASFGDSVGLELLAELCGLPEIDCEDHLGELVRRSLVERAGDRFGLHQLVRDFGRQTIGADLQALQDDALQVTHRFVEHHGQATPQDGDRLEAELGHLLGEVTPHLRTA